MASSPATQTTTTEKPWFETLRDGSDVLIRAVRPQDREAERAFIEGLSSQARHYRFLGGLCHPSEALLSRLTVIDPVREAAFVALDAGEVDSNILGVSRFSADSKGERCECAVTVSDQWQNRGLGTALMRHLINVARSRGMRTMYSVDLASNAAMNDLARHLGFSCRTDPDDPRQVVHELQL
ncbi:GNAT family N-acetyltransferase [Stenotrophomonas maltophilia]|nr:GNAT family N-acetyltransferase [Stenotrophomonas maltophilia]